MPADDHKWDKCLLKRDNSVYFWRRRLRSFVIVPVWGGGIRLVSTVGGTTLIKRTVLRASAGDVLKTTLTGTSPELAIRNIGGKFVLEKFTIFILYELPVVVKEFRLNTFIFNPILRHRCALQLVA